MQHCAAAGDEFVAVDLALTAVGVAAGHFEDGVLDAGEGAGLDDAVVVGGVSGETFVGCDGDEGDFLAVI